MATRAEFRLVSGPSPPPIRRDGGRGAPVVRVLRGAEGRQVELPVAERNQLPAPGDPNDRRNIIRYEARLRIGGQRRDAHLAARPGDEYFALKILADRYNMAERYEAYVNDLRVMRGRRRPQLHAVQDLWDDDMDAMGHGEVIDIIGVHEQPLPGPAPLNEGPPQVLVMHLLGLDGQPVHTQEVDYTKEVIESHRFFPVAKVQECLSDLFERDVSFAVLCELKPRGERVTTPKKFSEEDQIQVELSLAKSLGKAREMSSYADIVLKVDETEFKAHRVILAAQSDVFHAMFESNMIECSNGVVELADTNAEAVDAMLKYMYGRDLQHIQEDLVVAVDVLRLADKYDICGLRETCEKIIVSSEEDKFDVRTALHVYLCGYHINFPSLEEFAAKIVKSKYDEIKESQVFNDFMKANVDATRRLFYLVSKN